MAKRIPLPDVTVVRQLLNYEPKTGVFRWRETRGGTARAGAVAGAHKPCGHIVIKVSRTAYLAHRLAWVWMTGSDPKLDPDHANGIPDDNRWANLRPATFTQNKANSRRYKNNKSGFKGVSWKKTQGQWVAQLCVNKHVKYLGGFDTPEAAYKVYCRAAKEAFGEYARLT